MKFRYARKFVRLMLGLTILAFSVAMSFQAALGLSPWDVLHDGLGRNLGITPGDASIVLGALILALDLLFRERLGFGTFINVFVVGKLLDLVRYLDIIPNFTHCEGLEQLLPRLALCFGSIVLQSYGMYLYMSVEMGGGPRDSLMCALARRSKKLGVGSIRLIVEGVAFSAGWLLGGRIGLGSVILVVCSGPVMATVFRLLKFDVKTLRHRTIPETVTEIKAAHRTAV